MLVVSICMKSKKSHIESEIVGYKPFESTIPKPKKNKPKKKPRWKMGKPYDPTPKDFGKQYDPMEKIVAEAFYRAFRRSSDIQGH